MSKAHILVLQALSSLSFKENEKAGLKLNIQNEDHGNWSHQFMANKWGKSGNSVTFHFLELQNQCGQ